MGCVTGRIHYGLKVFFCCRHLLPTIIIIMQKCSQTLNTCKCLWSLSCGDVSNMLLVPSITFHCNYYVCGCMCSTGPSQFRWFKRYIHRSCYYHHQIWSINLAHCYHIFPWLCVWDVCYIIFCQGWVSSGRNLFLPGHPEKSGRNLFLPVLSGQNWKKLDKTGKNCERCQKCWKK